METDNMYNTVLFLSQATSPHERIHKLVMVSSGPVGVTVLVE